MTRGSDTSYEIGCEFCEESWFVTLPERWAVYRIESYLEDPEVPLNQFEPDPETAHGVHVLADIGESITLKPRCANGHFARISAMTIRYLTEDECLYGPEDQPDVRCPNCKFRLGSVQEYQFTEGLDAENQMFIKDVTQSKPAGSKQINSLRPSDCVQNDQLSLLRTCDGCGTELYLNLATRKAAQNTRYHG